MWLSCPVFFWLRSTPIKLLLFPLPFCVLAISSPSLGWEKKNVTISLIWSRPSVKTKINNFLIKCQNLLRMWVSAGYLWSGGGGGGGGGIDTFSWHQVWRNVRKSFISNNSLNALHSSAYCNYGNYCSPLRAELPMWYFLFIISEQKWYNCDIDYFWLILTYTRWLLLWFHFRCCIIWCII